MTTIRSIPRSRKSAPALRRSPLQIALLIAFGAVPQAYAQESKPAEQTLPTIEVSAGAEGQQKLQRPVSGGALGSRSQLDTPFSTTVVSSEELTDRQVTKLGDIFANDASASDNSNAYNAWAAYLTVRGMQLDWQNGYRIDGLPFVSYGITLPYEHFEQVELLKGLSGFMYGFVTPGGMVNYQTKRPPASGAPIRHVDIGYHSDSIFTQHADLGGRFSADDRFGYRLNLTNENGKAYSGTKIKRSSFSLGLDAKLTSDLTWTFNALYQDRETNAQTPSLYLGSYTSGSLPATISGSRKDLSGSDQHLNTTLQHYSTGLKYQLTSDWSLNADVSYAAVTRTRNEGILNLLNSSGAYNESRYDGAQGHRYTQFQASAQGKLRTGPFSHQLVLGTAWMKQFNDYSSNDTYFALGTGNIFNANTNRYDSTIGFKLFRDSDITQQALFASDTIQLTERWSVLAGVRHTSFEQKSYNAAGTTLSVYNKNVNTPTLALMYKPDAGTTLYGSYVESLEAGSIVGATYANRGAQLKPLLSKQYEAGVKTDRTRWSATAALFRVERGAEYAAAGNVLVQDGQSIFQGVELGAAWRASRQWEVSGNLMVLDSYYAKGTTYNGRRVAGAPDVVVTGRLSYNVPQVSGLKLFTDAKYTGKTSVRAAGGLDAPAYTVMNIGASYATRVQGYAVTYRAMVNNLLDKKYWMFQYADYVAPGAPRTVSLNAAIDF